MASTTTTTTAIHATSIDDFDVGQVIGRGGFGLVYRARHRATGQEVALKVLDKHALHAEGLAPRVLNEVRVHARVAGAAASAKGQQPHPHLVALRGFFEDDRGVYLVLEHCPRGDLFRFLRRHGPLRPEAAAAVMTQVLSALAHLHEAHGVVHRDVKLSNLLLCDAPAQAHATGGGASPSSSSSAAFPYTAKLADFGLAARLAGPEGGDAERFTVCGTYMAPEVATGQRCHGRPVDLWSAGCLLHSLLTGRTPPFAAAAAADSPAASPASPHDRALAFEDPPGLDAAGRDFLRRLLEPDPIRRPTARAMLAHPFLTGARFDEVAAAASEEDEGEEVTGELLGEEQSQSHSQSHSRSLLLLNDSSSVLTVVHGATRQHQPQQQQQQQQQPQHWVSSSASVATAAPSLPPPTRRDRLRSGPALAKGKKKGEEEEAPLLKPSLPALMLDIPPAAMAGGAGVDDDDPPAPHHRAHPRRSRRARAKVAAAQAEQRRDAGLMERGLVPPMPFLLPPAAAAAAAATGGAASGKKSHGHGGSPLIPIDAARLPAGRFLLPHPGGHHEGLLRIKRGGAVSLRMRALPAAHEREAAAGSRSGGWSLKVHPGGLRLRVRVRVGNSSSQAAEEAEYTLGELPRAYHAAYRYCWRLVQGVRAMTPKMTLFLVRRGGRGDGALAPAQAQAEAQADPRVLAKCMVMENGPLPDFKVRWADGAVLRYSLRTGQLSLALAEAPALPLLRAPSSSAAPPQQGLKRRRRHEWVIGGLGMECAATGEAGRYLGQAQWAMQRCLQVAAAAAGEPGSAAGFPLVLYEEVDGDEAGAEKDEARHRNDTHDHDSQSHCRWALVAAVPGVGEARRSPRGDLAVALTAAGGKKGPGAERAAAAAVVLVLNPEATQLLVLPAGTRYALPGLREVATGARMPKPLRGRMRALHRVLGSVGVVGVGVGSVSKKSVETDDLI